MYNKNSSLTDKIIIAFANIKPDKTQSLHQVQYTGDFGMSSDFSNSDYNAAAKKDTYKVWKDIPYKELLLCDCALTFATDDNFIFFLAATLYYATKEIESENLSNDLIDRVIFHLQYQPKIETGLNEKFELFNQNQQEVILQFFINCQNLANINMKNGGKFERLFNVADIPIIMLNNQI